MVELPPPPPAGALEEVRRLAGLSATIASVVPLEGGQHAATWRVDTEGPALSVVVRRFPPGDPAGESEVRILRALDGLGGSAPLLLGSDLFGRWSESPVTLISWLDGVADIVPDDPDRWATQLGHTLAGVHAATGDRLKVLPSVLERERNGEDGLDGPFAASVRSDWSRIAGSPEVLTHSDYWSGNVVWRDGVLTGVVDWSGAARGPRGYDVGWCRLDLVSALRRAARRCLPGGISGCQRSSSPRDRAVGQLGACAVGRDWPRWDANDQLAGARKIWTGPS